MTETINWEECGRCKRAGITTTLEFISGSTWKPWGVEPLPQKRHEAAAYHCPYHQCEIVEAPKGTWVCPHCGSELYTEKTAVPTCMYKVEDAGFKTGACNTKMIPLRNVIHMTKTIEKVTSEQRDSPSSS